MTLDEAKKLAGILEDFVPSDFDYKLSRVLNEAFPDIGWNTIQQCPVIVMPFLPEKK